ncbi:efflux RND transporter periplasmic adaptor subunit [Anaeromyxobacter sp. Fw109-5]|uniref:efflux RND transporter periplasmic adaptor subunit n=1 Tax=Anaeromyxobacter sp. (strain Fw109-5) TaxID=404589 RepID=UPI0000ED8B00|nr:HlyD family efflux transporter periplasmic adaptor subunit [Anaeromyxobacter sp. Fw109-5]ABS27158.1 efflux transporter, RND family, MFP subunit [Anaeromyxobacter sp. Fw109-5]
MAVRPTRAALLTLAAAALAGAVALALRPGRVPVEVGTVARGPIRETVDGTGKTRVRERFVVSAPVSGHLERVALRPGDEAEAGAVVAVVTPAASAPLDARTRAELQARLRVARAAQEEVRAAADRAGVEAAQAGRDLARVRALASGGSASASSVETAESAAQAGAQEAGRAEHAVRRAAAEVEAARAALAGASARGGERVPLRAPASGRVLAVLRESEGPIAAGTPILEIGDCCALEVEVELLTTQAVRVSPGAPVEIVRWGGPGTLAGRVRRVEPAAFTKVSALGVEEQRVLAIVDPVGEGWKRLGDGFSLEARVVVAARDDALLVPASALFRKGDRWATFAVEGGRARLREVTIAEQGESHAAIASGLAEGDRVVLHPTDALAGGTRVRAR